MSRTERALALFKEGFSCSQAVAAVFAEEHGLAVETALRLSQGFGGGMARMADTCGAVTGAILVLGLKHGRTRAADDEAKVIEGIAHVITEELMVEDRLNEEARQVLSEHSAHIERNDIAYSEMFKKVKRELAKKKGIVL